MRSAAEDVGGGGGGGGIDRGDTDELVFEKEVLWFQSSSYRRIYYLSNSSPMSLWPRSLVQASFNAAGPLGVHV